MHNLHGGTKRVTPIYNLTSRTFKRCRWFSDTLTEGNSNHQCVMGQSIKLRDVTAKHTMRTWFMAIRPANQNNQTGMIHNASISERQLGIQNMKCGMKFKALQRSEKGFLVFQSKSITSYMLTVQRTGKVQEIPKI